MAGWPKYGRVAKRTSGIDQIAMGSCQSAESEFIVCRLVALNKIDYSMLFYFNRKN